MIALPRYVFDSGALIQLERGDRRMAKLLEQLMKGKATAVIPRTVIAEIWRGGARQAPLAMLINLGELAERGHVAIDELTPQRTKEIGKKIGECGHDDIVDVNVAMCARNPHSGEINALILTADRNHILRVDEDLKRVIVDV